MAFDVINGETAAEGETGERNKKSGNARRLTISWIIQSMKLIFRRSS